MQGWCDTMDLELKKEWPGAMLFGAFKCVLGAEFFFCFSFNRSTVGVVGGVHQGTSSRFLLSAFPAHSLLHRCNLLWLVQENSWSYSQGASTSSPGAVPFTEPEPATRLGIFSFFSCLRALYTVFILFGGFW
eukprot:RCo049689